MTGSAATSNEAGEATPSAATMVSAASAVDESRDVPSIADNNTDNRPGGSTTRQVNARPLPDFVERAGAASSPSVTLADRQLETRETLSHITRPTSLSSSRTTPRLARVALPVLILGTHALFYYGQTAPMWKLRLFAHIDAWANATDFKSRTTFDTLGLDRELQFVYDQDEDVETFTYWYAIKQLWIAKGLPGKVLPRLAAILLVVFSGVWPHLKLFMLQLTWFFGNNPVRRTRILHWLSTLGKWSLADVLTVCVMVGVLNLDWEVEPDAIKKGVIASLPDLMVITRALYDRNELCDMLLKATCDTEKNIAMKAKCTACMKFLREAYTHPEWAKSTGRSILRGVETSGGGVATLRVVGMKGIYAFCGAVILSILWSVVVDIFDHKAKDDQARSLLYHRRRLMASDGNNTVNRNNSVSPRSRGETDSDALREPLLSNHLELELGGNDDNATTEIRRNVPARSGGVFSLSYFIIALAAVYVVLLAVDLDSMERQVHGAAPMLLHDILGVAWERTYSMRSLMWTTGAAGGWDFMLMATFSLFCVLGPILRSLLCVLVSILDKSSVLRRVFVPHVSLFINFMGAFCAWEVFVIAILMVDMLMPSITNTIIQKPFCAEISDDGSCLQVEFNVLRSHFQWIIVGGILLVGASYSAVRQGVNSEEGEQSMHASNPDRHQYSLLRADDLQVEEDDLEEVVFESGQS